MTAVVAGLCVLAVCGAALRALAMVLAFRREKLAAMPLVELDAKLTSRLDAVEARVLRVEARALR